MPPKKEQSVSVESRETVHRSVRVFAVAPIQSDELVQALENGISIDNIPLAEIVIGKKPQRGPSAGRVIAFGGTIEPGETEVAAAIREFGHETSILALGTQSTAQVWQQSIEEGSVRPFTYIPPNRPETQVYFFTLPVAARDVQVYEVRGRPGDNMEDVVVISPNEFQMLINEGEIRHGEIKIVGHMSKKSDDPISISPDQEILKNQELDRLVAEVRTFEHALREQILHEVNIMKQWKGMHDAENLAACDVAELHTAFISAQMNLDLAWERAQEVTMAEGFARDDSSIINQDGLKVAPYVSRENIRLHPELLLRLPTRELVHKTNLLKRAVKETLRTTHIQLDDRDVLKDLPWDEGLLPVLVTVKRRLSALPPVPRANALTALDLRMTDVVARSLGVSKETVFEATTKGGNQLFEDVTERLKGKIPGFQEHLAANEIEHSGLFGYVLMAFRIHPDLVRPLKDTDQITKKIQNEANRELALLFPAIQAMKEWQTSANDKLIDILIAEFFGVPLKEEQIDLYVAGKTVPHIVYHRRPNITIDGIRPHVIIDDRVKKSIVGLIRKSLLTNKRVPDNRATNIVVSVDNFQKKLSLEEYLHFSEELRDAMFEFFGNQLGSDWTVSLEWDSGDERYALARTYADLPAEERSDYIRDLVRLGGKRPGSQGFRLIRDQFRLVLRHESTNTTLIREIDMYPFEDTHHPFIPDEIRDADQYWKSEDTDDRVFAWGWRQKVRDHTQGNYEAARYYARSAKWQTEPSLYELLWASVYYSYLLKRVQQHQVVKRKDTK
jgi:8-oxo-dGTP pyrophosphatase MutT (NUDIX family)